jgi:predicted GNAT family N-acyltransferase
LSYHIFLSNREGEYEGSICLGMSINAMTRSPIIRLQEPPISLDGYDRSLPVLQQSVILPNTFIDAMSVREDVFVKEQGCSLLMEADPDDARSCHWVVYDKLPGESELKPAGTIRLVPFPHDPHPVPDSSWDFDPGAESAVMTYKKIPHIVDRATTHHDGKEPYFKLGRWAVRKEFRGRGLANLLVKTAFEWAKKNPKFFNIPLDVTALDQDDREIDGRIVAWRGLVCIHAQEQVASAWAKLGFKLDEGMGKWTEAGIPHVGMFQQLELY